MLMKIAEYARHRKTLGMREHSVHDVLRAIDTGRIKKAISKTSSGKLINAKVANELWPDGGSTYKHAK